MRTIFFILLALFVNSIFSQIIIKGTVYDEKGPLESVAVYLNNTMLGTTTNADGEFSIPVKEGQHELIVSYLGYKKIAYSLNTSTYTKPLVFALVEEENVLDEIVIKKTVYDDKWKNNLAVFKREFIGTTELAEDCEILNPKVLSFDYDYKENKLTAYARKPLQIKHKALGYLITYELESFIRHKNYITYLGYTRYQELKGGKRKQRRWKKNRQVAYNGSPVHFYKSLLNDTFTKEGFIVNQFKRVLNPERPSDEEIRKARQLLRLNRGLMINFSKKIDNPKTALDSALVTTRKSRLPKFRDYLYKSKLKKEDILGFKNNTYQLIFENNLSVVYTKEKEEMGYLRRNIFSKRRKPLPQTSSIIPIDDKIILDVTGNLVNPLDVLYEGYWSYEKFANTLPLDYIPTED
ncbi:carboxypeptidase-like regulatory domain-containing protein [Polaribacter porphyrae]|uniref:Carboxypeptidase-like regulatory domain-containing protein n=1 Tax=Polaribacter porphyrae TaxID=1137780 RepID=A0A2S7WQG0_9FLAO|nr:carboxypeptidase-like regulatory domain-containing protein [Polaribacter porphyrae]PQJ79676.1 hypothetical protein BTO18_11050 [Polaribacter porphyrae]